MSSIKIKVEIEKKLYIPKLRDNCFSCIADGYAVDCAGLDCSECLFDIENYKTFLEQQKGE